MTQNPVDHIQKFSKHLVRFIESTAAIWDAYQAVGPGRVDAQLFDGVDTLHDGLLELLQQEQLLTALASREIEPSEVQSALKTARDLAHRCACTAAGLSFVTGEAGLIPRKDLQDQLAHSLAYCGQVGAIFDTL